MPSNEDTELEALPTLYYSCPDCDGHGYFGLGEHTMEANTPCTTCHTAGQLIFDKERLERAITQRLQEARIEELKHWFEDKSNRFSLIASTPKQVLTLDLTSNFREAYLYRIAELSKEAE